MPEVRDELVKLAAGRDGDTTTVLLARTDLRSSLPGRMRTAALPAEPVTPAPVPPPTRTHTGPEPVPAVAAAGAAVADRPPPPPPTPQPAPADRGRRRGRGIWLAAALVVVLLAGLGAFLVLDPLGDDGGSAAQPSSPATTAATRDSTEPEPTPSEESTPSAETTPGAEATNSAQATNSAPADAESGPAQDPVQAVTDFFALLPADIAAAHQLTSPAFQAQFPLAQFSGFWDDFSSVRVSNIQTRNATTALADITYVRLDGSSQTERHVLTFIKGADGRLLLDRDRMA
jgi:hypothetical protein